MPRFKIVTRPMDMIYIYDGSHAGFFCAVHESVYSKELPLKIVSEAEFQPSVFPVKYIETDNGTAQKVMESIYKNISKRTLELVNYAFLCHHEDRELDMLKFILMSYEIGPKASYMFGETVAARILDMEKHLLMEMHLLRGFVRFHDYGGMLGATISPKNFVLPLLAKHFTDRFPNENFAIYDKAHKAALIYQDKNAEIIFIEEMEFKEESAEELHYQALWRRFYNTIGIKERLNPKCRMTHMPKRYWENMVEMKEFL